MALRGTLAWILSTMDLRASERDRGTVLRAKVQVSKPEDEKRRRNRAKSGRKRLKLGIKPLS